MLPQPPSLRTLSSFPLHQYCSFRFPLPRPLLCDKTVSAAAAAVQKAPQLPLALTFAAPQHPAPPPLASLQQLLPATIDSHCHHLASSPLPATIASMNKLQQSQKCCHRRCSYHRHKHTTSTGTNPPHPEHSSTSPPPPMT